MTTTVTVEAHCPDGFEVVITTTGCPCGTDGEKVIQNGEKFSSVVYDAKSIHVMEVKK